MGINFPIIPTSQFGQLSNPTPAATQRRLLLSLASLDQWANGLPLQRSMGGSIVRHEPITLAQLQQNREAYQVFQNAGWIVYFEKLQGFDPEIALEFTQNLRLPRTLVRGLLIWVTE